MGKERIKYYSTNRMAPVVDFREALLGGLAPDGGLFMPDRIPKLKTETLAGFKSREYPEIAFDVLNAFLENEIDNDHLKNICSEAYDFSVPLEKAENRKFILRLDQGPTCSFKDFAARIMARLIHFYIKSENKKLTILTATSGDTGSAVASAFHRLSGIDVIILFPLDEVSEMQRKQMTTLNENITAIGIDGKFDDCQKMAKMAFGDESLRRIPLTSANSINIGRLIPQSVYYLYAWSRLAETTNEKIIFSVPSGNFGNLMGGVIAREMGMPVEKFIICTNDNDEVPEYFLKGFYEPVVPSINCISNAMNVGHPSNLARLIDLYGGMMDETGRMIIKPDLEKMRKDFIAQSVSEEATRSTIMECEAKNKVLLEPHGAVAWRGLEKYLASAEGKQSKDKLCVSIETAHPAKFAEEVFRSTGIVPEMPAALTKIKNKAESYKKLENDYSCLKKFLLEKYN